MEDLDQAYGYILYRAHVPMGPSGETLLSVPGLHSYARVYVDGLFRGTMDRRLGTTQLRLPLHPGEKLDVLVENSGRINFTTKIRGERAGIVDEVLLNGHPLHGWEIFPLPMNEPPVTGYKNDACIGPCFYRGELHAQTPGDTYLNTTGMGKGVVWVNGHLLGRFWNVGPTGSLFLPGAWIHAGSNAVVLLDLNGGSSKQMQPEDHVTYRESQTEQSPTAHPM
jgi:beta-galactosidase